jgi:glycosyltransferase involved in cell wall biosynthesis
MHGLTIVARNYLPQARVLAASFRRHHPDASFATLVIDGTDDDRHDDAAGQILLVDDLGLPTSEWRPMAAMYTVMEFATALKPAALQHVLRRAAPGEAVAYIDPDIQIFQPIDDVFQRAAEHGIAVTPHVLHPMPRDGRTPDESVIMHAGMFNLGFICVGSAAMPMLEWWHQRMRTDAVVDLQRALFTDQRWIDWVPSLYAHTVERDPGLNVAYWNIHERPLTVGADGTVHASGTPLRFFHFSGFDPDVPWRLSKHAGPQPRGVLSADPVLTQLCAGYASLLDEQGFGRRAGTYGFDRAADGTVMHPLVRTAYRRTWMAAAAEGSTSPPDPYDPAQRSAFGDWFHGGVVGPPDAAITPWEYSLYLHRADISFTFPNINAGDAYRYRDWLDIDQHALDVRRQIGAPRRARTPRAVRADQRDTAGWNVVGYHAAEHGVGESARRVALAVRRIGIPCHMVGVHAAGARHQHRQQPTATDLLHRDTIYCINADETERVVSVLEHRDHRPGDARRIGLWFWEVSVLPHEHARAAALLDEVWVTSEFTRDVVQAAADVPVRVVPLPVLPITTPTTFRREHLGLPDGTLFTFSFDFNSVFERKNPLAAIAAYTAAFGPHDSTALVVKSINGHRDPLAYERLRWATRGRPDIHLIDGHWHEFEMQALVELSDCFVSLHRSEGFGLHLAAAMAAGKPVIATGYSGNLRFMNDDTAFLVPYQLVDVGAGNGPYPAHAQWAEPEIEAATRMMRSIVEQPDAAAAKGAAGRRHVLDVLGLDRAARELETVLVPELEAVR